MGELIKVDFGRGDGEGGTNSGGIPQEPERSILPVAEDEVVRTAIETKLQLKRAGAEYVAGKISHEAYGALLTASQEANERLTDEQRAFAGLSAQRIYEGDSWHS